MHIAVDTSKHLLTLRFTAANEVNREQVSILKEMWHFTGFG